MSSNQFVICCLRLNLLSDVSLIVTEEVFVRIATDEHALDEPEHEDEPGKDNAS